MSRSRFEQLTTPHRRDGEESGFLWTWLYLGFALVLALFLIQSVQHKQGSATPTAAASTQPSATPRPTPSPRLPSLPANFESQLKQSLKQVKWSVAAGNFKSTPQTLTWRVPATEIFAWDLRTLSPRSQALFRTLASQLKTGNLALQIEGAGLPARSGNLRWVSDWELSALQAARIADFLMLSQAPAERLQVLAGKAPQAGKPQSLGTLQLHFLAMPAPSPSPTPVFSSTPVAQRGQAVPALTGGVASSSPKSSVGSRPSALPASSLPLSRRSSNR